MVLPTEVEPGALRLPEPLRDPTRRLDWAVAAADLAAIWPYDAAPPAPGELAAATAIQAACAGWLEGQCQARPRLRDDVPLLETLDAAMAANAAAPWIGIALDHPAPPDAAFLPAVTVQGSLFDGLIAPFLAADSLVGQLAWVLERWEPFLSDSVRSAALVALDVLTEETTFRGFGGPGPTEAPGLGELVGEPGYSEEHDWMPGAVLTVRHGRVWLAQLSGWLDRAVTRLDQIPDFVLADLAHQGANVLWLVGIWERSPASRDIKRRRGNPEAAASAYSLVDYVVAADLGGEPALDRLAARARAAGLRLCADVVPNHTGIDSRWVVEHPEWFVQAKKPPFPGYRFTGPDLSGDPRVEVRIEDGYWTSSDAAVVFQRIDAESREVRYLYHGNDGTSMPWNDTAQLDLTRGDVRRALIDLVLRLSRRFGALRFDAAMALARQHVRRLWFPDAGEGGAIPSRAGKGLTEDEWVERMPNEFWVELVDAMRAEAPETLLLVEAFWLMEVDFARSWGLHRVYWSAFRDWVRDGDHGSHQSWLRDALVKEPILLGRLCLFLSNPDEESCAEAFGVGDRYWAAATLQATLPGMPLLAHGQVGGLREQYGMEFVRPRLDERAHTAMVSRHEAWIAPLLRRRDLFGRPEAFRLFPVHSSAGWIHDPIYALTNRHGSDRAFVLVNSSPERRRGTIRSANPTRTDVGLVAPTLSEALGLDADAGCLALHDARSGLWFLHRTEALDALDVELGPWECRTFLELIELADADGQWAALADRLDGRGVPDLQAALTEPVAVVEPLRAGVLLHPTSLPGRERTGTLGAEARRFVDWLAEAGFALWQVLPLNRVGPGESPYSSPASRLGEPLMIDLADLKRRGWLTRSELNKGRMKKRRKRVRHDKARRIKLPLLLRAADRLLSDTEHEEHLRFRAWLADHPFVADDALFAVLKAAHGGGPWWEWPEDERRPTPERLEALRAGHAAAVEREAVLAFWFDDQWSALLAHAESMGVTLVGDVPIYVALDSADVWTAPERFELDEGGRPLRVSAVPPDAFAAEGQLWGNPIYAWDVHAAEGYAWWVERIRRAREWTPTLRIDHFRGFSAFYAVSGDATSARDGVWEPGPGTALFEAVDAALGKAPAIAEDLGTIDEDVHALREATGMLGTRVLQFGVGGEPEGVHHPSQLREDAAVYTGTHDNDTTIGWFQGLDEVARAAVAEDLGVEPHKKAVASALIDAALGSPCRYAILPMQDVLGLGRAGRMNQPGTAWGNWSWRMVRDAEGAEAWRERLGGCGRAG